MCIWLLTYAGYRAVQPISYKALVEEWPLQCYQLLIPLCGEAVELGISGMIVVITTLGVLNACPGDSNSSKLVDIDRSYQQ